MNRREFISFGALAMAGCVTAKNNNNVATATSAAPSKPRFHVFSKMFQSPVTKSPEELCDLMAGAGYDGIQWTVRPNGHACAANVDKELPRLVKIAEARGLKIETICTAITGRDADSERIVKTAGDCGIKLFRPGYYFYNQRKRESIASSLDRIHKGFDELYSLAESANMRFAYQNHSTWGSPTSHGEIFGAPIWDLYVILKDYDPKHAGVEFDLMHALFENFHSWTQAMERIAPYIATFDLKDFRYTMDKKNSGWVYKEMCAAGEGIVPFAQMAKFQKQFGAYAPYCVHFEYDFDKTELKKSVKTELDAFKKMLGC